MPKSSLYSALTSSYGIFHKRSPPLCLADLFSVSTLVKVTNCAHTAIVNTKMIILSRNWTGGQVAMTKAKDMLYECVMIREHCIVWYRASVWCCMEWRLELDHIICPSVLSLRIYSKLHGRFPQNLFHRNVTTWKLFCFPVKMVSLWVRGRAVMGLRIKVSQINGAIRFRMDTLIFVRKDTRLARKPPESRYLQGLQFKGTKMPL